MADIFVSHSSSDKRAIVEPLVRILKARNTIWNYSEQVGYGDSIPLAISEGLSRCDTFLLVLSTNYNQSEWCQRELGAIIANCMGTRKRMLLVQVDDFPIPAIMADMFSMRCSTAAPAISQLAEQIDKAILRFAGQPVQKLYRNVEMAADSLVDTVMGAAEQGDFGGNLLPRSRPPALERAWDVKTSPHSEGVILVKPGGTFYRPCLTEIFRRVCGVCEIEQVRVFSGHVVEVRRLFEKQYMNPCKIANGDIPLTAADISQIRSIYDKPEFQDEYGVPYSDDLIIPALKLVTRYRMDPDRISQLWEEGRAPERFRIRNWNGLNKIGYQRSVFPIACEYFTDPPVHIVINGYIPGFRRLFTHPDSLSVAIHVSSALPWRDVRENLVGGNSNPAECKPASIRRDAYEGRISLDPQDSLVNGQRNVCHCSATLFDGMLELVNWFEYPPHRTILGQVFEQRGIALDNVMAVSETILAPISWTTRDDPVDDILYEVRRRVVLDDLRGAGKRQQEAVSRWANEAKVGQNQVTASRGAMDMIRDGLRLEIAGEDYYLKTIADKLHPDQRERFYIVAKKIKEMFDQRASRPVEVLAEAYRIAASDLMFLESPALKKASNPGFFRDRVVLELPEQALGCASRTRSNLVEELNPHTPDAHHPGTTIAETREWAEFLRELPQVTADPSPVKCLILAGGRSTRMSSTIPKPVLPFGNSFLIDSVAANLQRATDKAATVYAAVGHRASLIRDALGDRVRCLEYGQTLGLGFRVATCLEYSSRAGSDQDLIVLTYTDMPLVSSLAVKQLIRQVAKNNRAFGLLSSCADTLSGHISRQGDTIERIIQQRLHPNQCDPAMERDVGVYVFHNTPEFRQALGTTRNNNVRKEFIFADVVEVLANDAWQIISTKVEPDLAQGVNTAADLLYLASRAYQHGATMSQIRYALEHNYGLQIPGEMDLSMFVDRVKAHYGPFYFFPWWERTWSGEG